MAQEASAEPNRGYETAEESRGSPEKEIEAAAAFTRGGEDEVHAIDSEHPKSIHSVGRL